MALESSVNYIGDLVVTNPTDADAKAQGAAHLRNTKKAARQSFAGFAGAILVSGSDTGSANTYVLAPSTALPGYVDRMLVLFRPASTNSSGAPTINISSLGTKTIKGPTGAALTAGDIVADRPVLLQYNGTDFLLVAGAGFALKTYVDGLVLSSALPGQTGNSGKFTTTDGTTASWAHVGYEYTARSSDTQLTSADARLFLDLTSTFTQTFDSAANLGAKWTVRIRNNGSGVITIPDCDGVTNWPMYPGEIRDFYVDGASLKSSVLKSFYYAAPASGTHIDPPGYSLIEGELYGAGGSGRKDSAAANKSGGGGGACTPFRYAPTPGASNAYTVGSGGAAQTTNATNGNAGGDSTFKTWTSGGGVGGTNSVTSGGAAYSGSVAIAGVTSAAPTGDATGSLYGGGSCSTIAGRGPAVFGGSGGGSITSADAIIAPAGTQFGGAGGAAVLAANGTDGTAPGGGGGATKTGTQSGAGARGEFRAWGIV